MRTATTSNPDVLKSASWLQLVEEQVSELRFGVVQITVHEGRVVQIERTEKVRLAPSSRLTDQP